MPRQENSLKIAIASGKGGTGKTFVATNIAVVLAERGRQVSYLDCDVEEPNGHLFLKPVIGKEEAVVLRVPVGVDEAKCTNCGRCSEVCHYNAVVQVKGKILFFPELCHACGACKLVCPEEAVIEKNKLIGTLKHGKSDSIDFHYALLETGAGGMSPRLIRRVKACSPAGINILDAPPGTACPAVEAVKDADLCVLVTDPTPFGVNDLKLAVDMCRQLEQEPVVLVNRAEYRTGELKEYCRKAGLAVIGEIPDDRRIAEIYSVGDLAVKKFPRYQEMFERLAERMLEAAGKKRPLGKILTVPSAGKKKKVVTAQELPASDAGKPKELVVISGKGGTGKTSLAAAFAALAEEVVIADCDVDAADLHLILEPEIEENGDFSGGVKAEIAQDKCTACGQCYQHCRFSAIRRRNRAGKQIFTIDPVACEGCGVCQLVCPEAAVNTEDAINGEWFVSRTRFGPFSHARLGIAEENSGRLVTLVRNNAARIANATNRKTALLDGAPGTGCPVVASLTGVDFALVVAEPTVSGIHDLVRILEVTRHFGVKSGVVVNKYDLNPEMTAKIRTMMEKARVEFLGIIPYDKAVTEAQIKRLSVVEYAGSPASKSVRQIWKKIKVHLSK